MNLGELHEMLSTGELSSLKYKNGISEEDQPKINRHIIMGLHNLYTRFPLYEKEVIIEQVEHINQYTLSAKYAQTNTDSNEPYKYIADSIYYPFTGDVIRINAAFNELGDEIELNDEFSPNSIFTVSYNSIQIPYPIEGNQTCLTYRAKHPVLTGDLDQEIELPEPLYEAITTYVAARVFGAMGGQERMAEGASYKRIYDRICGDVTNNNVLHFGLNNTNTKLYNGGWV